jgi:hypothetical protein
MKNHKIIEKAIISFNIANNNPNEISFATIGDFDQKYQLTPFNNVQKDKWAINIDEITMNNQTLKQNYNAIIDTGSSLYSLPEEIYNFVLKNLDSKTYCN